MALVAIVSPTDGRPYVSGPIAAEVRRSEERLAAAVEALGHEPLCAPEPLGSSEAVVAAARAAAARRPALAVVNLAVWAFPNFTMLAARELDCPLLLFAPLDPVRPGMVGMLAAGGALDQIRRRHGRVWGDAAEPQVRAALGREIAAAAALQALRGTTFGRFGGRPMGMYTAVADGAEWMRRFGVDVEEIDQWEVVRRAQLADPAELRRGREWLERHAAGVHYDGAQLTPELLERQLGAYLALRELIDEWGLAFTGIKSQPELTEHFATTDVPEALLNDPYDWNGPKEPHVCATEADMDAALTMQLLKGLSGTPVLFADVRHYHADRGVWDLCNSGQHATWFAERSDEPAVNLARVHLYPEGFYFPAGGASVHHVAAPGKFTFARLSRLGDRYRMQVIRGELERYDDDTNEQLCRASTPEWPHAFARLEAPPEEILSRYGSNHIHAIPGDHVETLRAACRQAELDFDGFGGAA